MCDDDDFDYRKLATDFCENAAGQADDEEQISNKIAEMKAAGIDMSDLVLGDYLFDARAKAKLAMHGLTPNDAIEAINDPKAKPEHSNSTGEHVVRGRCTKGRIWVVYWDSIGKANREQAAYTVTTGFDPRG